RETARVDLAGRRVLLFQPNNTLASVIATVIESLGVECVVAQDAESGLATLRRANADGRPFDLAVVDRSTDKADVGDVALTIQREEGWSRARIIVLAYAGQRTHSDREAAGVTLSKPVRRGHLTAAVRTLLGSPVEQARFRSRTGFVPPTAEEIAAATRRMGRTQPEPERPRVLVVDDNLVNQRVSVALVEKRGYRADVVGNGADAVEAVLGTPYAAVLMDCSMPRLDGFAATAQIRQAEGGKRRTPIIAMTTNTAPGDRERCLAAGMDDYLAKPIAHDELERVLKTYCPLQPERDAKRASPKLKRRSKPPAQPIDLAVLERLRSLQAPGEPDVVDEIIALFLNDAPTRVA